MLMAVNTMNEFGNIFNTAAAAAVVCEPYAEISGKFLFLNNKTNHIATNIQTQAEREGGREREEDGAEWKIIKLDIIFPC